MKLRISSDTAAVTGLARALGKTETPILQRHAAMALANLAWEGESSKLAILNTDGALAGLLGALLKGNHYLFQHFAGLALAKIAQGEESSILSRMRSEDGLLTALTTAGAYDDGPALQEEAKLALEKLKSARDLV
ncbi:unnamed protein product [Calypogeia fissa]